MAFFLSVHDQRIQAVLLGLAARTQDCRACHSSQFGATTFYYPGQWMHCIAPFSNNATFGHSPWGSRLCIGNPSRDIELMQGEKDGHLIHLAASSCLGRLELLILLGRAVRDPFVQA